jgi:hypothetical protein
MSILKPGSMMRISRWARHEIVSTHPESFSESDKFDQQTNVLGSNYFRGKKDAPDDTKLWLK